MQSAIQVLIFNSAWPSLCRLAFCSWRVYACIIHVWWQIKWYVAHLNPLVNAHNEKCYTNSLYCETPLSFSFNEENLIFNAVYQHKIMKFWDETEDRMKLVAYFLGSTRSTRTDSAPAMMLSAATEDIKSALRFRSRSSDAKFSFVAMTFGAMPNSLKSCNIMQTVIHM